jgi:3-dehydroquinate dehydratase/shikimate dehydrogenase
LLAAAHETDAYIDFEFADWKRSADIRQKVKLAAARPDGSVPRLILSAHDFSGPPGDLSALTDEIVSSDEAVAAKVAYHTSDICGSFDAVDQMHRHGVRTAAIAMGEDGLWTRVLAKKLGAFASYCASDEVTATAPGQLPLDEMVSRYRWNTINATTKVFGVIGDPIAHSMSPLVFNRWFADVDINAVYLPLRVCHERDCIRRFLDGCLERSWLDIGGFSVTTPHKSSALGWVGDGADWMARRIGAVNTLTFRDAEVGGYNTDCYAAVSSVAEALGRSRSDLAGLTIDVLGAGGAARAVLYGFPMFGCEVTVYGRSEDKTRRLAEEFGVRTASWDERAKRRGDVLVNCTNVGMWPHVEDSPMPPDSLGGCTLVFDVIYNPLETRLLRDAAAGACKTLDGLDMFVRQAAMQFELWFGRSPDKQVAHKLIVQAIQHASPHG